MSDEKIPNTERIVQLAEALFQEPKNKVIEFPGIDGCLGDFGIGGSLMNGFSEENFHHLLGCAECVKRISLRVKSEDFCLLAVEKNVLPVLKDSESCNVELRFVACEANQKQDAFLDLEFKIEGALNGYSDSVFLGNGCVCVVFYGAEVSKRVKDCFMNSQSVIDTVVLSCALGKIGCVGQTSAEFLVR